MDGTRSATPARRRSRPASGGSYPGKAVHASGRSTRSCRLIDCTSPRCIAATVDPLGEVAELDLKRPRHIGNGLKAQPDPAPTRDPQPEKHSPAGAVAALGASDTTSGDTNLS